MAFRADTVAPKAYDNIVDQMLGVRARAYEVVSIYAGGANANRVLSDAQYAKDVQATIVSLAQTPGLIQYAKNTRNDQNYDVVAEGQAVLAALDAAFTATLAVIPIDPNGYREVLQVDAVTGGRTLRRFNTGQLNSAAAAWQTVFDSITVA